MDVLFSNFFCVSFLIPCYGYGLGICQTSRSYFLAELFVNWVFDNIVIFGFVKQNILFNVWFTTSELRDSVTTKRINLQQLKQEMKLNLILKEQVRSLVFFFPLYQFVILLASHFILVIS